MDGTNPAPWDDEWLEMHRNRLTEPIVRPFWCFLFPIPVAVSIFFTMQCILFGNNPFESGFLFNIARVILMYLAFPCGLFNPLILISPLPHYPDYCGPFCFWIGIAGWFFYGYLTIKGLAFPTQKRFRILCLLLVINIIGLMLPDPSVKVPK